MTLQEKIVACAKEITKDLVDDTVGRITLGVDYFGVWHKRTEFEADYTEKWYESDSQNCWKNFFIKSSLEETVSIKKDEFELGEKLIHHAVAIELSKTGKAHTGFY